MANSTALQTQNDKTTNNRKQRQSGQSNNGRSEFRNGDC